METPKTPQEIFKQTLTKLGFHDYKPSQMTNSDYWLCTTKAMEAYGNQCAEQARREERERHAGLVELAHSVSYGPTPEDTKKALAAAGYEGKEDHL